VDENPEPSKAKIVLSPENTELQVAPGSKKNIKLTLVSQKAGEDLYELSVKGIPIEWVSLENRVLQLKQGESREVELFLAVPDSPDIRPGRYPFIIQANSQADRQVEATASGQLTVAVYQSEGRIGIWLSHVQFVVTPGNRIVVPLLLQNRGLAADTFRLEVKGLPAAWLALPEALNRLDPGEQKGIEFSIFPPRAPESSAGYRSFTIEISSQTSPNQPERVQCGLTVAAFYAFSSQMQPQYIAPGEPAIIRVQNESNLPDVFSLEWMSQGDTLKFERIKRETAASLTGGQPETRLSYSNITTPEVLRLQPGKIGSVEFRARPWRLPIVGGEFSFPFSFRLQSSSSKRIFTHNGAVLGRALIPVWVPAVVGILLIGLICAGIFAAATRLNAASRATQTAQTAVAMVVESTQTAAFLQTQTALPSSTAGIPVTGLTATPSPTNTIPAPTATNTTAPVVPTATNTGPPPTATFTAQPPTPTATPTIPTQTPTPTVSATPQNPAITGTILFQSNRDGNFQIYVMDAATLMVTPLTQGLSPDTQPALSPDGVSVAYVSLQANNNDIFLTGLDHRTPVDLTNDPANDQQPAWSPDGQSIAFTTNRDGNNEIYVMGADGSQPHDITNDPANDFSPFWFQTGGLLNRQDWIVFTSNRSGTDEIYIMKPDGSGLRQLTTDPSNNFSPTASSSQVAFVSDRTGNQEIYIMNLDGTGQTNLTNNLVPDYDPVFSPDGSWVAFTSMRDGNPEIYVMKKDGTGVFDLTRNPAQDSYPSWR
jgi:Tol biopolymer transport system component